MRTRILATALAAAIAIASLAGCTASASSGSSAVGGAAAKGSVASGSRSDAASTSADRSIVTTGTLHLVARDPIAVADRITSLVDSAGGRIDRSTADPSGRPSAHLVVRIPAAGFEPVLTAIEHTGHVRDVTVDSSDVTARVTDTGVRIASLRASISRLQQLLAKATSSTDLVQLEGALTDRQTSLEQLLAQQRTLADQVASATLDVSVVVPAAVPPAGPSDFVGGLLAGTQGLVHALAAFAVGFGVALPWLLALGVVGALSALAVRVVRRRTRATSA